MTSSNNPMPAATRAKRIGVLPLARNTFDVPFAESMAAEAWQRLDATGYELLGSQALLFDATEARIAIDALHEQAPDLILVLQITFTDASMTVAIADEFEQPLAIWAMPEPRIGGRLRLNAFCGLNLAAHALGLNQRRFGYLYADPARAESADDLAELLAGARQNEAVEPVSEPAHAPIDSGAIDALLARLSARKFARLGEHPQGFHTCAYNAEALHHLLGIEVDAFPIDHLFTRAKQVDQARVDRLRAELEPRLNGLAEVDQLELERSLRMKNALDDIQREGDYSALAIRCWPETFTDYGAAICGPVSMLGERRVPCACEADVFGALSALLLQELADAPAFQVDLVDINRQDGSCVVWHCGQAPVSMADPAEPPLATIHTNRKKPLLYEFALKPGRVTFARISQAQGELKLVIAGGEMLKRPKAFTGTSGVVRYDAPAERLEATIMAAGLEHHSCLVYGDYRAELHAVAERLDIPCLDIH